MCLSGRLFGADDFLPMLTYILAKCDMPELDNEILYMMELLDPSQLHGEGECQVQGDLPAHYRDVEMLGTNKKS